MSQWFRLRATGIRIGWFVCLLVACVCRSASTAGVPDSSALTTTIFRDVGGVNGSSVTAIAQDGAGFLWFGGQSGLTRWDGYTFRPFVPNRSIAGSLPSSYVNVLHTDRRGRLWVGTTAGGLSRYDEASDSFVNYRAGPAGPGAETVLTLTDDDAGGLWIGTTAGLDRYDDTTGRFEHFRHVAGVPGSLPAGEVHSVLRDGDGTLWVATDGGLVRRDHDRAAFDAVPLRTGDGKTALAWSLFADGTRRIWIGTWQHGVYVVGADRRARPVRVAAAGKAAGLVVDATIEAIGEVRPGLMWFGTQDQGIVSLDVTAQRLGWMQNDPAVTTSLPQNTVRALYRDRAGLMWVGTLNGLRRSDPGQRGISTIAVASKTAPGVASVDTTAIFAAPDGRMWFALGGDGIEIIDVPGGGPGSRRLPRTTSLRGLPHLNVSIMVGSPDGHVYVGTDRGLYRGDARGNYGTRVPLGMARRDNIIALCVSDGAIWAGTMSDGLWRVGPQESGSWRATRIRMAALTDGRISALAPAGHERLWVGTYGGLNLVDTRTGAVERIFPHLADPAALGAGFISALLTDRRGRLWVGTYGGGVEILERRGPGGRPRFRQISVAQGLPNVNVDALLEDRQGRMWAATDDGIGVIAADTFAVRALHRADGVELTTYWMGAGAMLENGDLLFGASGGVTVVRPALVRDWSYRPPVVVSDVRIGGRHVTPIPLAPNGRAAPYIVTPTSNSIAVEFAALDYSAPEQNRYAYRLDGFDTDWTETESRQRVAAYTNLPPGAYTLELRGSNRNGAWAFARSLVSIRVEPAWHQTIAFKLAEGVAALAILATIVQVRTAYFRRRERELERQVSERTAELETLAVELRSRKAQLELIAYHDPLTDLPNRRMFAEHLTELLDAARTQNRTCAVLLIDLDRFKAINDTLGHDAGDAVLVEAALRLRSVIRASDGIARLGGDEFAIALGADCERAELDAICRRIVNGFAAPITFAGVDVMTSPSIGIAVFPRDGESRDVLLKSADIALYEAKRAGRNTWRWFTLAAA
jgi:diguanylate cyclase (GGDEF)-like protein